MRKKDKLYTVSKWNQPLFMPKENLFGAGSQMFKPQDAGILGNVPSQTELNNNIRGIQPSGINWNQPITSSIPSQGYQISSDRVPQQSAPTSQSNQGGFNWGNIGKGAATAAAFIPSNEITLNEGQNNETTFQRGAWDMADPMYWISGGQNGYKSEVGEGLSDTGVALTKTGNPWLMLAGAGFKIAGDVANARTGTKTNQGLESQIKDTTNYLQNYNSNAGSYDGLQRFTGAPVYEDVYSFGKWANRKTRNKVRRQNAQLRADYEDALAWADNSYLNNLHNIQREQINNALRNYSAFGGPIDVMQQDNDMSAINYGFMADYLNAKRQQAEAKNNNMTNMFAGMPATMFAKGGRIHINPKNKGKFNATKKRTGKTTEELTHSKNPLTRKRAIFAQNARKWHHSLGGPIYLGAIPQEGIFALGGDIETNGGDFTNGLMQINAGGSHEMNPNEGIQMGVDPQGTPNLVEEGETVFDDYVFSNRIVADANVIERLHLPKNTNKTYAEVSKILEKKNEVNEKPNDPIAQAGFKAQLAVLAEEQERQKQEMEAQKAQEAFAALSPEEQVAVMQDAAQQQIMPDGSQAQIAPIQVACGGRLNKFASGGLKKQIYSMLPDVHTDEDFRKWVEDANKDRKGTTLNYDILLGLLNDNDYNTLRTNSLFWDLALKDNPALAHAIESGYDFGIYNPDNVDRATIQSINKGNWEATDGAGWFGSDDEAFKQATKGLTEAQIRGLKAEDLAARMKNTEAYKNTSEWLNDSDNALLYLNTLLNDSLTPEAAKQYARQFVDNGNWKPGFTYDYDTVFGNVRNTNPGTYWHSVVEANRDNVARNFVQDEDGNWQQIETDVPVDWIKANSYAWNDPAGAYVYNYYTKPVPVAEEENAVVDVPPVEETPVVTEDGRIVPVHRNENIRYAGLFGPAVGLGMMQMGIGKPDYTEMDNAVAMSKQAPALAGYKTIGDYLTYRPMDIWAEQNALNAQARATDRAIMNSNSPSRFAGIVANGYNSQLASGELYRKALEYNDAKRAQVGEFNRGTNQFNAEAFNRVSPTNAEIKNRARQYASSLGMQVAAHKLANDASWYNSLYGNINGLFKGFSELGRENATRNMYADLAATGAFGQIDPDSFNPNGMLRWETEEERKKRQKSANGGRLRKRDKGLTL